MKIKDVFPQEQTLKLADGENYTFSELHLNAQAAIEIRITRHIESIVARAGFLSSKTRRTPKGASR